MAAGECVASLAITEPDAGSDMQVGGWSILFVILIVWSIDRELGQRPNEMGRIG